MPFIPVISPRRVLNRTIARADCRYTWLVTSLGEPDIVISNTFPSLNPTHRFDDPSHFIYCITEWYTQNVTRWDVPSEHEGITVHLGSSLTYPLICVEVLNGRLSLQNVCIR